MMDIFDIPTKGPFQCYGKVLVRNQFSYIHIPEVFEYSLEYYDNQQTLLWLRSPNAYYRVKDALPMYKEICDKMLLRVFICGKIIDILIKQSSLNQTQAFEPVVKLLALEMGLDHEVLLYRIRKEPCFYYEQFLQDKRIQNSPFVRYLSIIDGGASKVKAVFKNPLAGEDGSTVEKPEKKKPKPKNSTGSELLPKAKTETSPISSLLNSQPVKTVNSTNSQNSNVKKIKTEESAKIKPLINPAVISRTRKIKTETVDSVEHVNLPDKGMSKRYRTATPAFPVHRIVSNTYQYEAPQKLYLECTTPLECEAEEIMCSYCGSCFSDDERAESHVRRHQEDLLQKYCGSQVDKILGEGKMNDGFELIRQCIDDALQFSNPEYCAKRCPSVNKP